MKATYTRAPGIEERRVGGSLFLAHPTSGDLYRANSTLAALWSALAEPLTGIELVALFHHAFPRVGERRMQTEVETMLKDLVAAGLVERSAPARRR